MRPSLIWFKFKIICYFVIHYNYHFFNIFKYILLMLITIIFCFFKFLFSLPIKHFTITCKNISTFMCTNRCVCRTKGKTNSLKNWCGQCSSSNATKWVYIKINQIYVYRCQWKFYGGEKHWGLHPLLTLKTIFRTINLVFKIESILYLKVHFLMLLN